MRYIKKKENMFIIGIFSLLVANLLGRFGGQYIFTNFLEGLFTGFSLVMMLCFLVRFGKERRMNDEISQNRS
jgi:hypothetical protein